MVAVVVALRLLSPLQEEGKAQPEPEPGPILVVVAVALRLLHPL